MKYCVDTAGAEVDHLLTSDPPVIKEAWIRMSGWYRDVEDPPPPHTHTHTGKSCNLKDYGREIGVVPESSPPWAEHTGIAGPVTHKLLGSGG